MADDQTFSVIRKHDALTMFFSSTMENIDNADAEVKQLLNELGLSEHSFSIRIVMREGLTNSVRHAHNYNPKKIIKLDIRLDQNQLIITIEDQGKGFDWRSKVPCNQPKNDPVKPLDHGRGLPIMADYVDEYWYNDKGNILTFKKDISS